MPRKRPNQLRKLVDPPLATSRPPARIPGLSEAATRRLATAEQSQGWCPGRSAELLEAWSRVTREPGYPLCLPVPVCSCPYCDPIGARWLLAELMADLPRRERALLRTPLARIDRWYAARTLPDPHSTSDYWFERRLMEQEGGGRLNR
ncbi:hypothetical protein Ate01nite_42430 [Actinoplanes teichomyceticus]|nr:hypothetical protein Ate01nite_42430 [Actinoplanes teichomyceticus]